MRKNILVFIFAVLFLTGCGPTRTNVNPYYSINLNPSSTFYDKRTNLTWKMPTGKIPNTNNYTVYQVKTLDGAKTVCSEMNVGGYDDWRLADIKELVTLIDYKKKSKFMKTYRGAMYTMVVDEYKDAQILYSYQYSEDFISSTKNAKGETLAVSYIYGTIKTKDFKYFSDKGYSGWLICTRGELSKDYIKNINKPKY